MGIEGLPIEHTLECGEDESVITLDRGQDIEVECAAGHTHHIPWTEILPYV